MDYMSLTDEELLSAVKNARISASKSGVDIALAIKGALQVYLEEKITKEQKEQFVKTIQENAPIMETNFATEETNQEIKETFTDKSLEEFIGKNSEQLAEEIRVGALYMSGMEQKDIEKYTKLAASGLLRGMRYDTLLSRTREESRKEVEDYLTTANSLARENYYAHCMYASDMAIRAEKIDAIRIYYQLRHDGTAGFVENQKSESWATRDGIPEDLEQERYNDWTQDDTRGIGIIQHSHYSEYDPLSFDQEAAFIKRQISKPATKITMESFQSARRRIGEMISKLEHMTEEEYRAYKIAQMKLTPEEKALFDEHISEYVRSKEGQSK